jgi:hypothetical protein
MVQKLVRPHAFASLLVGARVQGMRPALWRLSKFGLVNLNRFRQKLLQQLPTSWNLANVTYHIRKKYKKSILAISPMLYIQSGKMDVTPREAYHAV